MIDSLRRRFQQNQEDCTITILELLPSVTEAILEALPAEQISKDIQQKNAEKTGKLAAAPSEAIPSDFSSGTPSVTDEDGRSMTSFRSESYVHASQMGSSSTGSTDRTAKTKVQLWNELKITCKYKSQRRFQRESADDVHHSHNTCLHLNIFCGALEPLDPDST